MARSVVLGLVVLGLAGCGGSDSTAPAATNAITIRDNSFSPAVITVGSQVTVTWTWRGADTHNVTFEDGQGSSSTQVSGTHARAFAAAGTYRFRCTVHSENFSSGMSGSVLVP